MPWPISTCGMTSVVAPSASMRMKAFGANLPSVVSRGCVRLVDGGAQRQVEGEQEAAGEAAGQQRAAGDVGRSVVRFMARPHD